MGVALRWLSFAFAARAVLAISSGLAGAGAGALEALLTSLTAAFWSGLGALALYGGSEVVRLALDVEARTRHLASPTPPEPDDDLPAS